MLTIMHTNDLHGGIGMLPRLAATIARERARGGATLLVDAGDAGLGGTTVDLCVALLAGLGYDALTPGNAETDLPGHRAALCRVGVPIVVANVADGDLGGRSLPFLMREVGGVRVALLGLTTPPVYPRGHPLYRPRAAEVPVGDAGAAAAHWVPALRARAGSQ